MILEAEGIHCYYGLSHVVHGVSLGVGAGEVVSLLGRNGAGKTTTIHAIMGLVPPRSGAIRVAGASIAGQPPHEIYRRGVAWVPQGRRIFPTLSVEENVRLATLKAPGGTGPNGRDRVYALFPILRERRGALAGTLSGGERQMLAIARALVGDTRVLLLDEPTEGLAPLVIRDLERVIREIASHGVAILLAEQNVRMALATADRHYILDKGEVRAAGTTREIEDQEEVLVTYLGVAARSGSSGR